VLILVRHGRTRANALGQLLGRRDPGLDEVGRQQSASIAASLATRPLSVVSSPLLRCVDTAQMICDRVDGPVEILIDPRFIEIDYGELEGARVADVPAATWKRWREDPSWSPGGGESLTDVSRRVAAGLDELVERPSDVVIVTHVSPIKAALGWVLGVGPEISWKCHVAQASVHRIDQSGTVPQLVSFNETHHLRF